MPHHNDLLITPLFHPSFFECNATLDIETPFPLPSSAETLEAFFASDEGEQFKNGTTLLLEKLAVWTQNNGIDAENLCQNFKKKFIGYSGSDAQMNHIQFPLYKQGVPQLVGILGLLENAQIPLTIRVNTITNLIQGMDVCGPGVFTNITDAYWKLNSQLSISIEWMVARHAIAEQVALHTLQTIKEKLGQQNNKRLIGMEIHFVNAVLNQYSEALAIKNIEDDYIVYCDANILIELMESFALEIPKYLTPIAVMNHILSEHSLNNSIWQAYKKINDFEQNLERYGQDPLFTMSQLATDSETVPTLKWDHEYTLFLTLNRRLTQSRYLDPLSFARTFTLADGQVQISYLFENSLKFASVVSHNEQFPLISYFVQVLQQESPEFQAILDFVLSSHCSDEQRCDLIFGMTDFMQSNNCNFLPELKENHDYLEKNTQRLSHWIDLILHLNSGNAQFDIILYNLPMIAQQMYIEKIGFHRLHVMIQSCSQLINALKTLPEESKERLLNDIGTKRLAELLKTGTQLAEALSALPVQQWPAIYPVIPLNKQRIYLADEHITALLKMIFLRFPIDGWSEHCRHILPKGWQASITNLSQLCDLFKELPEDKASFLLHSFNTEQLTAISYHTDIRLRRRYKLEELTEFFKQAPKEKAHLFLTKFDNILLKKMFGNLIEISYVIDDLSYEKSESILKALGKSHIESIFDQHHLLFSISLFKLKTIKQLFSYLSVETIVNNIGCLELVISINQSISQDKAKFFFNLLGSEGLKKFLSSTQRSVSNLRLLYMIPKELSEHCAALVGVDFIKENFNLQSLFNLSKMLAHIIAKERLRDRDVFEVSLEICNKESMQSIIDLVGPEHITFVLHTGFCHFAHIIIVKNKTDLQQSLIEMDELLKNEDNLNIFNAISHIMDKETQRQLLKNWILFFFHLTYSSKEETLHYLSTIQPPELWTMTRMMATRFDAIPADKCSLLFSRCSEEQFSLLAIQLQKRVVEIKSFHTLFVAIPELRRHKVLLGHFEPSELSSLIHSRETLCFVLQALDTPYQLGLLEAFSAQQLYTLFIKDHRLDESLAFARIHSSAPQIRDIVLLGSLRGHKYGLQLSRLRRFMFWQNSSHEKEMHAYNVLETSLLKNIETSMALQTTERAGISFFNQITRDPSQRETTTYFYEGDLAKFAGTFYQL